MKFYQILSWFQRNLKDIILSQRKTIAYLVYGLIKSKKIGVASIGRGMKSKTSVKHNIKRVARYLKNERIDIKKSLKKLQEIICKDSNRLVILLDWTTISNYGYQVLKATIIGDGRGLPIAFKTYSEGEIKKRQTEYEKKFLDYLKTVTREDQEVIIVGDRGFGLKPGLLKYIESIGFYYVMRNKEDYIIKNDSYKGKISDFKTKIGHVYTLKNVEWPDLQNRPKKIKEKRITSDIVITHKRGCKKRWVLSTNNKKLSTDEIIKIYYKRMTIEETFKDEKNIRQGYGLKKMRLSSPDRYDKMLLIICYSYLLITLFGLYMERNNMHKKLMPNTVKYRSYSLFQVGHHYYKYYDISIPKLLKLIKIIHYRSEVYIYNELLN